MLGHAGNASALQAYWTREFGKGWEQYPVAGEMIDAALTASEAWQKIAAKLMHMDRRPLHGRQHQNDDDDDAGDKHTG